MIFSRMRRLGAATSLVALCAALPLWAAEFVVPSQPSAVTIHANAAIVTREISLELPEGRHQVILPDLPDFAADSITKLDVAAADLRGVQFQTEALPDRDLQEHPRIAAKRAELDAAEAALDENTQALRRVDLPRAAIEARQTYFRELWRNHEAASDVESVKELAEMITAEVEAAQKALLVLDQDKKALSDERLELEEAVTELAEDLDALEDSVSERAEMTLDIQADTAGPVRITLQYASDGYWRPEYAAYMERDTGRVRMDRFVVLSNEGGEPWSNVAVEVSTTLMSDQGAATIVRPNIRTIAPPPVQVQSLRSKAMADGEVMVEPRITVGEVEMASGGSEVITDLNVTYRLDAPVTLWPGSDAARIALSSLVFDAEQIVRAAPRFDETAFLSAKFINDSAEPLLEGETFLYVDGALVAVGYINEIPAGGEEELPFGPIPAVRVGFKLLDKQDGDAGVISRSNTRTDTARLELENFGDKAYTVLVRDRVPVSEHEDLTVEWSAVPAPDIKDVEDKRGVLEWEMELAPGAKDAILIETEMRWPLDQVLR